MARPAAWARGATLDGTRVTVVVMNAASSRRETMALSVARGATTVALCGIGLSPPLVNIGVFVALLAFLVVPSAPHRLAEVLRLPLARAALVLFGVLVLATLWSDAAWAHRIDILVDWRTLLLLVLVLAVFSGSAEDSDAAKARMARVFVALAVLAALVSSVAWVMGRVLITDQAAGTVLRNHSTQSMFLIVGVTLALALAARERARDGRSRRMSWLWLAAAVLIAGNLLFATVGRSGQVAFAVVATTLVFTLLKGRVRLWLLLGLPAVLAAIVAASPVIRAQFGRGWQEVQSVEQSPEVTSMGMRIVIWRTVVALGSERPGFGFGTGGLRDAYAAKTVTMNTGWRAVPVNDAHNQYLFVWIETGVIGLLALLAFIAVAAWQPAARPWKQVASALLLAWAVSSLFSSHFQTFNEGHLIMLLLGVLLAPTRSQASAANTADSTAS